MIVESKAEMCKWSIAEIDDKHIPLLVNSEGIIHPIVSVLTLTWFIKYIYV